MFNVLYMYVYSDVFSKCTGLQVRVLYAVNDNTMSCSDLFLYVSIFILHMGRLCFYLHMHHTVVQMIIKLSCFLGFGAEVPGWNALISDHYNRKQTIIRTQ